MKYVLEVELLKGYEEMAVGMLDNAVKYLDDNGVIKINKQEKIGKPFFETVEKAIQNLK